MTRNQSRRALSQNGHSAKMPNELVRHTLSFSFSVSLTCEDGIQSGPLTFDHITRSCRGLSTLKISSPRKISSVDARCLLRYDRSEGTRGGKIRIQSSSYFIMISGYMQRAGRACSQAAWRL